MKKYDLDFMNYINIMEPKDFAIIDPPWNLNDRPPKTHKQLDYTLWKYNIEDLLWIMKHIKTKVILLWYIKSIEQEIYEAIHYHNQDSITKVDDWIVKTDLTWVKLTKNNKIHYGLGHWFRNSVEGIKLIVKRDVKPFRFAMRNVFHKKSQALTEKPKDWEKKLVYNLYNKGYKNGCYIFSGTNVDIFKAYPIECVDIKL